MLTSGLRESSKVRIPFTEYGCVHEHACPIDSDATAIISISTASNWITIVPEIFWSGASPIHCAVRA
jgi:hypothetical protein